MPVRSGIIVVGAGAFIIDSKDRILLTRSAFWKGGYMIPGGTVEYGEGIFDAIKREVKEEVGLDVKPVGVLAVAEDIFPRQHAEKKHYVYFNVLCRPLSRKIKLDNYEITECLWVDVNRAVKIVGHPTVRRTILAYIKQKKLGKLDFINISA